MTKHKIDFDFSLIIVSKSAKALKQTQTNSLQNELR